MLKAIVNADYCKACEMCLLACKKGALSAASDINVLGYHPMVVDDTKCIGCRLCAVVCPDAAIEVR